MLRVLMGILMMRDCCLARRLVVSNERLMLDRPRRGSKYPPPGCISETRGQVIGDRLRSHKDECRATEVAVAVHALNRMLELGRPNYVRVA